MFNIHLKFLRSPGRSSEPNRRSARGGLGQGSHRYIWSRNPDCQVCERDRCAKAIHSPRCRPAPTMHQHVRQEPDLRYDELVALIAAWAGGFAIRRFSGKFCSNGRGCSACYKALWARADWARAFSRRTGKSRHEGSVRQLCSWSSRRRWRHPIATGRISSLIANDRFTATQGPPARQRSVGPRHAAGVDPIFVQSGRR
jgi:hypothetical protein